MPAQSDLNQLLPLSPPVFHVLLALGAEAKHGYAIMQSFEALTDGAEQLLPGTLYATLARMVESGLIEEADPGDASADRRRRYYRATERGRAVAALEGQRMTRLLDVARRQKMAPETPR